MRFVNPILFVSEISASKDFYNNTLGLAIQEDHGQFVLFEFGFAIHDGKSLYETVWKDTTTHNSTYGANNLLLYFDDDNIDQLYSRISSKVQLIHGIERQAWGQRVFRFYDPDFHTIEIGEPQMKNTESGS